MKLLDIFQYRHFKKRGKEAGKKRERKRGRKQMECQETLKHPLGTRNQKFTK